MRAPWRKDPRSAWAGGVEEETGPGALGRVREALAEQLEYAPSLSDAFSDRSSDASGKVLNLGEQLINFSLSPLGRGLTATLALTMAWLII